MDRFYTPSKTIKRLLLGLLIFVGVGWLFGYVAQALILYFGLIVLWNSYHLLQLSHWLWNTRTTHVPQVSGVWSDIYDGLHRTLKRQRTRRQRLTSLLQRFRQAAEALPDAGLIVRSEERRVGKEWRDRWSASA